MQKNNNCSQILINIIETRGSKVQIPEDLFKCVMAKCSFMKLFQLPGIEPTPVEYRLCILPLS